MFIQGFIDMSGYLQKVTPLPSSFTMLSIKNWRPVSSEVFHGCKLTRLAAGPVKVDGPCADLKSGSGGLVVGVLSSWWASFCMRIIALLMVQTILFFWRPEVLVRFKV
jgi:hypothetical protein